MIKSIIKNKRGNIPDLLFFIIFVIGLALFLVVLRYVANEVSDRLLETSLNDSDNARGALESTRNLTAKFDALWLFIFIALLIGVLISSFMIHAHPIFIPVYIILFGFAVVVGVIMNNIYLEFIENATLSAVAATHTFMNTIINNYVLVIIGVGILSMIIMFARPRGADRI